MDNKEDMLFSMLKDQYEENGIITYHKLAQALISKFRDHGEEYFRECLKNTYSKIDLLFSNKTFLNVLTNVGEQEILLSTYHRIKLNENLILLSKYYDLDLKLSKDYPAILAIIS